MSKFSDSLIDIISKSAPILGSALGGPAGGIIGSLISSSLGIDINKPEEVAKKIESDPSFVEKLKELEMHINDLQNARLEAGKDTGYYKLVRPLLALVAMLAIFIDIMLITYVVNDSLVEQVLILLAVFLVWDVRQIYRFYFGNGDDNTPFPFTFRNKN